MSIRSPRRRAGLSLAAVIATLMVAIAGLALAGCSAVRDSSPTSAGQPGAEQAGGGANFSKDEGAPPAQAPTKIEPQERSLVYTGTMTVRVDDVVASANQAAAIAAAAGGVVSGDRRTLDSSRSVALVVLRVPADRFNATLDQLAKLGAEQSRQISTDDVTEEVIDVQARLATQRTSVERVRALLAQAKTISEVLAIESELRSREAELASLQQRSERLSNLVALSTITLDLRGPAAPEVEQPDTGFIAGLKSGWAAFRASVKALLTFLGFVLPWLIVVAIPVWLLVWLRRRHRRRTVTPSAQP